MALLLHFATTVVALQTLRHSLRCGTRLMLTRADGTPVRDTTTIVKRPEFAEKYVTSTGLDVVANSPAEFADAIRADVAIVGAMVRAAGLRPE